MRRQLSSSGSSRTFATRKKAEVTEEHLRDIQEAFDQFDAEETGSIDYHELKVAIRALGFEVTKEEAHRLAIGADHAKTGRIDAPAFAEIMTRKIQDREPDEDIEKAFQLFDDDGTGIGLAQLKRVAADLGEDIDDSELEAMITEFAPNGTVTLAEFSYILRQTSSWE